MKCPPQNFRPTFPKLNPASAFEFGCTNSELNGIGKNKLSCSTPNVGNDVSDATGVFDVFDKSHLLTGLTGFPCLMSLTCFMSLTEVCGCCVRCVSCD